MNDSVILVIADSRYIPHVKSLMVNCVRQGNWLGDFCLLCPGTCHYSSIVNRGIWIMHANQQHWTNAIKFQIFGPEFQQWKRVLYLDADCIVQGDLNIACEKAASRFPKILCDSQDTTVLQDWVHFDPAPDKHPEIYRKLVEKYPCATKEIRTSDVMFFSPQSIPPGTVEKLTEIQEEFKDINPGSYDQQVMDLALYDQMEPIGKDFCTWFAFDEPCNRVKSETRGWRGDEEPVVLHYWSMYAPWIIKPQGAGGHFNYRLNRVVHELYAENLNLFEETFPRE